MMKLLGLGLMIVLILGGSITQAQDDKVTFQSTQFNIVEEAEKARVIISNFEGDAEFIGIEEAPLIDLLKAESASNQGSTDVVGALHGTYPVLVNDDLLFDLSDLT